MANTVRRVRIKANEGTDQEQHNGSRLLNEADKNKIKQVTTWMRKR
jgi:hypothetical protein